MKTLVALLALLAVSCSSCTPAERQTAVDAGQVAEVGCMIIVSIEAPGAEGLCVKADELYNAAVAVFGSAAPAAAMAATAAASTTPDGKTVVPAAVFAKLAAQPTIKARNVAAAKAKPCGAGRVAP